MERIINEHIAELKGETMTRADKIKEYVKERYGVEINETLLEQTEFRFQGCDGLECPEECMHEDCSPPDCDKCKYNNFWEQEDDDVLSNF